MSAPRPIQVEEIAVRSVNPLPFVPNTPYAADEGRQNSLKVGVPKQYAGVKNRSLEPVAVGCIIRAHVLPVSMTSYGE